MVPAPSASPRVHPAPSARSGALVTFDPARHRLAHPRSAKLLGTAGCGCVQREGGPIGKSGRRLWCPPGEHHWPETPKTRFALAVQETPTARRTCMAGQRDSTGLLGPPRASGASFAVAPCRALRFLDEVREQSAPAAAPALATAGETGGTIPRPCPPARAIASHSRFGSSRCGERRQEVWRVMAGPWPGSSSGPRAPHAPRPPLYAAIAIGGSRRGWTRNHVVGVNHVRCLPGEAEMVAPWPAGRAVRRHPRPRRPPSTRRIRANLVGRPPASPGGFRLRAESSVGAPSSAATRAARASVAVVWETRMRPPFRRRAESSGEMRRVRRPGRAPPRRFSAADQIGVVPRR